MKVRVNYTIDVDDDIRREINAHYGKPGLASRDEVKAWYETYGSSMDMDLSDDAAHREQYEMDHDDEEGGDR